MRSIRAALAGLVDYAGLFPPASLPLSQVVANHQRYFTGAASWLLGRLIVPIGRLEEVASLVGGTTGDAAPWTIAVLARGESDLDRVASALERFNERGRSAAAVAVELGAASPAEVERAARLVPERYERYVEVGLDDGLDAVLDAIAANGCYAKVRTGGVEPHAFPAAAPLCRFIAACAARDVPFKATAGLHHPIRGSYRLTYEPQSAAGLMHGFVNLVLASGLIALGRADHSTAAALLETTDASAFTVSDEALGWGPYQLDLQECIRTRAHVIRSVGSCSFEEPVEDLTRMGWVR